MTQPIHHNHLSPRESPIRTNHVVQVKEQSPDPDIEPEIVEPPLVDRINLNEEDIEEDNEEDNKEDNEEDNEEVGPSKMPMSPSIEYLDDDDYDEEEDDDDKFNYDHVAPSMVLRPPPTSISTIRLSQQNRIKWVLTDFFVCWFSSTDLLKFQNKTIKRNGCSFKSLERSSWKVTGTSRFVKVKGWIHHITKFELF
jgi:hypothetical protein